MQQEPDPLSFPYAKFQCGEERKAGFLTRFPVSWLSSYFAWRNASYSALRKGSAGTRATELVEIEGEGGQDHFRDEARVKHCRDLKQRNFDAALRKETTSPIPIIVLLFQQINTLRTALECKFYCCVKFVKIWQNEFKNRNETERIGLPEFYLLENIYSYA